MQAPGRRPGQATAAVSHDAFMRTPEPSESREGVDRQNRAPPIEETKARFATG